MDSRTSMGEDVSSPVNGNSRHVTFKEIKYFLRLGVASSKLRITGWQWSKAELPVRVDAVVQIVARFALSI